MSLAVAQLPLVALGAYCVALSMLPGCGGTAATLRALDDGKIVLRRSEGEDPKALDPHKTGDVISSRHTGLCYDCLLQYDYLKRDPVELVPCLVSEMPAMEVRPLLDSSGAPLKDAHGKPRVNVVYTFKLRDDVYFADDRCFHPDARGKDYAQEGEAKQSVRGKGRKLVAADMVYSFKRLAALPDSEGFWIVEGKIAGLDAFHGKMVELKDKGKDPADPDREWREGMNEPVAGLEAPDDRTFRVTLVEPYPQFLYSITLTYGSAIAHEAANYYGKELSRKPVGTGAFILSKWRFNSELVYDRNPNYRDERFPTSSAPEDEPYKPFMGLKLPLADRIVFSIIKESQPSFLEFKQGNLDVSGLSKDQFSAAITPQSELTPELANKGIKLMKYEDPTLSYMVFNMNDPDVGTRGGERARAIRRAMAMCLDRDDYVRRYQNGRGTVTQQLIPPGIIGATTENNMPSQAYDPEAGREVLKRAGFKVEEISRGVYVAKDASGKQPSVNVLLRRNDSAARDYAIFLKTCGDRVGINIVCEPLQFAEFLKRQNEGTGQVYDAGWVMDYPDAQNMLQLLYGPNKPPSGNNNAYYASDEFDKLYVEMRNLDQTVPEHRARKLQLIKEMHAIVDKDVPWVITFFSRVFSLYHSWYVPPKPNAFAYTYFKFYHAETRKRGELAVSWAEMPWWPGAMLALLLVIPAAMMSYRSIRQAR